MVAAKYTGPKGTGVNLERFSTLQEHELGTVVDGISPLGFGAKFKYVKFVDAVTYKQYDCVCLASATQHDVSQDRAGGSSLANNWPAGSLFSATAANVPTQNQYGWIQVTGICYFTAGSAAIIAGDPLKPDSTEDGDVEEATAGTDENICGIAQATVADNATGLMMLQIRGI